MIEKDLLAWKNNPAKKPLMVFGARQVGKTHSVMAFGKENYSDILYFNFENNTPLCSVFEKDLDVDRILTALTALSGKKINPGQTLVFFDEIQAAPKAITSLKYFCENAPEYHIIAAGSLLGVSVNRESVSFPVGKIDSMTMYPMNFGEFLLATGNEALLTLIEESYNTDSPLVEALHDKAMGLYKTYLLVGGMPECVSEYIGTKDFDFVRVKQNRIFNDYASDMSKYSTKAEAVRHEMTYNSVPSQLAKENKKFQYKFISSGARARQYEDSIDWLTKAGIVLKCERANEGKVPIEFYKDKFSFKLYMSDVGLLTAKMMVPPATVLSDINFGGEAKGAITENYVAQQLAANKLKSYYWSSASTAEVDFVVQLNEYAIPVECKSNDNVRARSLRVYMDKYTPPYVIRISSKNFGFENGIKSVPLYAAFCIGPNKALPQVK